MQSKIDDISKIIKEQIRNYESRTRQDEIGYVISVGDGISKVHGLDKCKANELLEFSNGSYGMALNLEETFVSCVLLGSDVGIKEGSVVKRTGRVVSVPTGEGLIGRVVDALGNPLDGKGPTGITEYSPIERREYGIIERKSVSVPLQTGIKAIDSMIPIGRGQRELIIGDRQTGKTVIATDTIINQKGKDVICIYVAIGQKQSTVTGVVDTLYRAGAMDYTIVGTSGGNTDDMIESLKLMEAGKINPSAMISHVGGLDAVIPATLNLPNIPGGKKLIYTGIKMELTAIADFAEKGKTNPLFAKLDACVKANNGLWNAEAEKILLAELV